MQSLLLQLKTTTQSEQHASGYAITPLLLPSFLSKTGFLNLWVTGEFLRGHRLTLSRFSS